MDAITKQKTLTGVLVALFVGSAFAGVVFPTAQASHFTPGATDAILDGGNPVSVVFNGTTYTNTPTIVAPSSGSVVYNTTYDLVFTNISVVPTITGYAYAPGGVTALKLLRPDYTCQTNSCNTRPSTNDNTGGLHPSGNINVTFPGFTPDAAGLWSLRDDSNNTVTTFFVMPSSSLTVSLSKTSFAASTSEQAFTVTVSPVLSGQTVVINSSDATGTLLAPQTIAGTASGTATYTFVGPLAQAGTFTIWASREIYNASNEWTLDYPPVRSAPEIQGSAVLTVSGAALTVTPVDKTVRAGFTENASFDITYANGTAVFAGVNNGLYLGFIYANVSVTTPTGDIIWQNVSSNATSIATSSTGCAPGTFDRRITDNASAAASTSSLHNSTLIPFSASFTAFCTANTTAQALAGGVWQFSPGGRFYFRPAATWNAGTYTVNVLVNTAGSLTAATMAEFSGSATVSTIAPAAINLKVFQTNLAGSEVQNLTVLPATLGATTATAGTYTLEVQVLGPTATTYPLTTAVTNGGFAIANVSVSGDLLPGAVVTLDTTASGSCPGGTSVCGVVVSNVVPTSVKGTVTITVSWAGSSGTVALPIVKGAVSAASVNSITVDTTSTVTITLTDKFGNIAPHGQVFLFDATNGVYYPGVGQASVNGTGDVGAGFNGQYTFNIKPTAVGNLVAFGIIGTIDQGIDNRNYTYVNIKVVPAHDVTTTLSTTSAMASATTYVFLNATTSDGVGLATTGASAAKIYFLTDDEFRDFQNNGTSQFAGGSQPTAIGGACCWPPAAGNNFGTVALGTFSTAGFNLNVTLLNGTYHVYVVSTDGKHDNNASIPTFTVSKFHAVFSPAQIANNPNVQSNTLVNVTITDTAGNLWNGSLILNRTNVAALAGGNYSCVTTVNNTCTAGTTPVAAQTVSIVNGVGQFVATGLDIGAISYDFDPTTAIVGAPTTSTSAPTQSPVDTPFQVVGPNVVVTPNQIPIGKASSLSISVKDLNGKALPNIWVTICGTPIGGNVTNPACTGGVLTDANGQGLVGVNPISTGTLTLFINNASTPTTVTVYAGLVISWTPPSPVQNDTVTITVAQVGQSVGESGVTVTITQNGTAVSGFPQTTTSNGQVVLPSVKQGTYNVTAAKAGFQNSTAQIIVGAPVVQPPAKAPKFELQNLNAPSTGTVGSALTASADLLNTGDADGTATVLLLVNGAVRDSRSIPVNAGGKETVAFDFTPTQAGSFKVTVKLSTGETLAEKTVTVTAPTPTQTTTSTSTSTTSTSTTSTTTTSTSPVTSSPAASTPTPKVPGFEVVALIGALAVAMLVLRRRKA